MDDAADVQVHMNCRPVQTYTCSLCLTLHSATCKSADRLRACVLRCVWGGPEKVLPGTRILGSHRATPIPSKQHWQMNKHRQNVTRSMFVTKTLFNRGLFATAYDGACLELMRRISPPLLTFLYLDVLPCSQHPTIVMLHDLHPAATADESFYSHCVNMHGLAMLPVAWMPFLYVHNCEVSDTTDSSCLIPCYAWQELGDKGRCSWLLCP